MSVKNKSNIPELRKANKAQLAEFFDVTLPTVESWVRKGAPVVSRGARGVSWEFDLRAVAEWLFTGKVENRTADPQDMTPQDRKAWYEAEARRRDMQVQDRELVPRVEVEQAVAMAFSAITQDILAIPDLLERSHGVSADVAEKVEQGLSAALDGLAERLGNLGPVEAGVAA